MSWLLPLVSGSELLLLDPADTKDGEGLAAALRLAGATSLVAPAPVWRRLLGAGWRSAPSFKAIVSGIPPMDVAEGLVASGASAWFAWSAGQDRPWSTLTRLEHTEDADRLGPLLAGATLALLDGDGQRLPTGVPGPLVEQDGRGGIRPTGVRARRLEDGRLQWMGWLGRRRFVGGRVVEPAEVEVALRSIPGVVDAAVRFVDRTGEETRLTAQWVPATGAQLTDSELRRHLRRLLPEVMVPRGFQETDRIPRRPDGTLDERALGHSDRAVTSRLPASTEEKLLGNLWCETLGLRAVTVQDNFFNLGGHSLLCLQLVGRVQAATGRRLNPRILLLGTLEQAAAELAQGVAGGH